MYSQTTKISHPIQVKSFICIILLALFSTNSFSEEPHLLFKSSFDSGTYIDRSSIHFKIRGKDSVSGFNWDTNLPGDRWYSNLNIDDVENWRDYVDFSIVNVVGHDGKPTNSLRTEYIQDDPTNEARKTRASWYLRTNDSFPDDINRFRELYWTLWMKIDLQTGGSDWSLPFEWKAEDGRYRIGLYIANIKAGQTPYWALQGQLGTAYSPPTDWYYTNKTIPVEYNKWVKMEMHWRHDGSNGFMRVAIDNKILFDHHGRTARDANELFYIMPFKIYGAKGWSTRSDFEIWDKAPITSILNPEYELTSQEKKPANVFTIVPGKLY